jgi:hypothetical protein
MKRPVYSDKTLFSCHDFIRSISTLFLPPSFIAFIYAFYFFVLPHCSFLLGSFPVLYVNFFFFPDNNVKRVVMIQSKKHVSPSLFWIARETHVSDITQCAQFEIIGTTDVQNTCIILETFIRNIYI